MSHNDTEHCYNSYNCDVVAFFDVHKEFAFLDRMYNDRAVRNPPCVNITLKKAPSIKEDVYKSIPRRGICDSLVSRKDEQHLVYSRKVTIYRMAYTGRDSQPIWEKPSANSPVLAPTSGKLKAYSAIT